MKREKIAIIKAMAGLIWEIMKFIFAISFIVFTIKGIVGLF